MDGDMYAPTVFDSYYELKHSATQSKHEEPTVRVRRRSITDFSDVALYQDCVAAINKVVIEYVQRTSQSKNVTGAVEFILTATLETLFARCSNDHAKRLLYYMVSNQECGSYLRNSHGIWLTGQPKGNRSTLSINMDKLIPLSFRSDVVLDAWKRHKLLSKILYHF